MRNLQKMPLGGLQEEGVSFCRPFAFLKKSKGQRKFQKMKIKVELCLFASLGRYLPRAERGNCCIVEIHPGTTIRELLGQLNIPAEAPKIFFLNGVHAQGDEVLKDGDRVGVFPPVAGG